MKFTVMLQDSHVLMVIEAKSARKARQIFNRQITFKRGSEGIVWQILHQLKKEAK